MSILLHCCRKHVYFAIFIGWICISLCTLRIQFRIGANMIVMIMSVIFIFAAKAVQIWVVFKGKVRAQMRNKMQILISVFSARPSIRS